jgi:hypothetical protein
MKKKKKQQIYNIKIDSDKVMTEQELREYLYGEAPTSPLEVIGYELSAGYFSAWLVVIISIIALLIGLFIGGFDCARRFSLPVSEVFSLSLSKSDYAYSPMTGHIEYGYNNSTTTGYNITDNHNDDTVTGLDSLIPEGINVDGATINIYQGDVYIGDTYDDAVYNYENRDNQYISATDNSGNSSTPSVQNPDNDESSSVSESSDTENLDIVENKNDTELDSDVVDDSQIDDNDGIEINIENQDVSDDQLDKSDNSDIIQDNSYTHANGPIVFNITKSSSDDGNPKKEKDDTNIDIQDSKDDDNESWRILTLMTLLP